MCIRHSSLTFCCRLPQLFPTITGFPPINISFCNVWSMIKLFKCQFMVAQSISNSVPVQFQVIKILILTLYQIAMCNVKVDFWNDGSTLTHRSWLWLFSTSAISQLFSAQKHVQQQTEDSERLAGGYYPRELNYRHKRE